MATLCSACGEELPQDARFCSHCGATGSALSSSSPSFASADTNLSSDGTLAGNGQAASQNLREQASPQLRGRQQSASPMRALRVKVWNGVDGVRSQPELKENGMQQEDVKYVHAENKRSVDGGMQEEQSVEDLPTRLMESIPLQAAIDDVPTNPILALPNEQLLATPEQQKYAQSQHESAFADVSHISTVHLQAQQQSQAMPPSPLPSGDNHNAVRFTSSPALPTRSRKRLPLIVGSSAVLLLLVLAAGSWIVLAQPFRVSPATDTQQSFTDAKLGVSLRYPSGWKKPQVDYQKQMITLQDGSDTAQINIYVVNASTDSPESYLQKQVTQFGINNAKVGASSSFAGASWKSTQGDAQVKGAEYTCGVFTTLHNNHFYTLTQLAPRTVYADEEKLVFAPARLSLHFL